MIGQFQFAPKGTGAPGDAQCSSGPTTLVSHAALVSSVQLMPFLLQGWGLQEERL